MTQNSPFHEKTQKSAALYQEACRWIPGGVTANIKYFDPYPILMEKAKGPYLYDVDGNSDTAITCVMEL